MAQTRTCCTVPARSSLATLVLTAALALPGSAAQAATVTGGDRISVVAAPGELNKITVSWAEGSETAVITDSGAPLTAGPGCSRTSRGVECAASGETEYDIETRDRVDRVDVRLIDKVRPYFEYVRADLGRGDDRIVGGPGLGLIAEGGDGSDVLIGSSGSDLLRGGRGGDRLFGGDGGDTLNGGEGPDDLNGEGGPDALMGLTGNDSLDGGPEADRLLGGVGNDYVLGARGDDDLRGGPGADRIDSAHRIVGEKGRKVLERRRDTVNCGEGQGEGLVRDGRDRTRRCERIRTT